MKNMQSFLPLHKGINKGKGRRALALIFFLRKFSFQNVKDTGKEKPVVIKVK